MKRLAARPPDLDIFSQSFVLRDNAGWQITDAGRAFLDFLQTPIQPRRRLIPLPRPPRTIAAQWLKSARFFCGVARTDAVLRGDLPARCSLCDFWRRQIAGPLWLAHGWFKMMAHELLRQAATILGAGWSKGANARDFTGRIVPSYVGSRVDTADFVEWPAQTRFLFELRVGAVHELVLEQARELRTAIAQRVLRDRPRRCRAQRRTELDSALGTKKCTMLFL